MIHARSSTRRATKAVKHDGRSGMLIAPSSRVTRRTLRLETRRRGSRDWLLLLGVLGSGALGACSLDGLLKSNELPPNVTDPAITQTPEGARAAYNGTLDGLQQAFGGNRSGEGAILITTGLLSDELSGTEGIGVTDPVSLRQLVESPTTLFSIDVVFKNLNSTRQRARQAGGLASDYLPEEPALRAHLYTIEGYTEVMLAELFCSGIPLSTVDYHGDYTLRPGSRTEDVFEHATTLFDSALALVGTTDSVRILNLSRVGRARALLGRGDYAAAAATVAEVPDTFRYTLRYTAASDSSRGIGFYNGNGGQLWTTNGVADQEGTSGLDYRSSSDPRVRTTQLSNGFYYPTKYHVNGADTIVLASGVEARLIAAEDAMRRGDPSWLDMLNALRTTGSALVADTIKDTLGVSGCKPYPDYCGGPDGPGGTTPDRGQPVGGFPMPDGYSLVDSVFLTNLSSEIRSYCSAYSWYQPCYSQGMTTVYVYAGPASEHWLPGTGGVSDLPPLDDPGTTDGRVDLLFRERAFWLFLTGHRQGDMRRLVRQYNRSKEAVYPVGTSPYGGVYGAYIDAPIPWSERTLNPEFTGCMSRD